MIINIHVETRWCNPEFFKARFEILSEVRPFHCSIKMVFDEKARTMAGKQSTTFEEIKKIKQRFSHYEFRIDGFKLKEKITNSTVIIEMETQLTQKTKEEFMYYMFSALRIMYYEIIDEEAIKKMEKPKQKFFTVSKPLEIFYEEKEKLFRLRKDYDFKEKNTFAICRKGEFFYVIETRRSDESKEYYQEIRTTVQKLFKNRKIHLKADKKTALPHID